MMQRDKIELLAPAKNLFFGKEAINCGADSLYIGAPKFSMRAFFHNSLDDIKELVKYAHKYWVKVYAAVNCLLYTEDDFKDALNIINELYKIDIDGIIVQDLGILELDLPPVPIVLSTNTMCFKKEDAQFYEKLGIDKIVLPRELSFENIKEIASNTNIKLEAFCYGFLCAGISGNCYLEYAESLNNPEYKEKAQYYSSNHGYCIGRCLYDWTLKDANGNIIKEHERLLNQKYLHLINDLERLYDIGVNSFKIAGRERDLVFVKNVVAMYSQKINEIASKKHIKRVSSGRTILGFTPGENMSFNKGHTDFFLNGRKKEMYSKDTLIGENAGKVLECDKDTFIINSNIEISVGDRFRYKKENSPVKTFKIKDISGNKYLAESLEDNIKGLEIYRYFNAKGFAETENSVNHRVISVELEFYDNKVKAKDEDGNIIETAYLSGVEKKEIQKNDFCKIYDDMEFIVDSVISSKPLCIDNLDEFLKNIFLLLRKEREKNRPIYKAKIIKNNEPYYKKELSEFDNVVNKYSYEFFKRHGVQKIEPGLETSRHIKGKKIFCSKYCLRNELGFCSKTNPINMPPLPWTIEQDDGSRKYEVAFNCKDCKMSYFAKED